MIDASSETYFHYWHLKSRMKDIEKAIKIILMLFH